LVDCEGVSNAARGVLKETAWICLSPQEHCHSLPQVDVGAASGVEEGCALIYSLFQNLIEYLFVSHEFSPGPEMALYQDKRDIQTASTTDFPKISGFSLSREP